MTMKCLLLGGDAHGRHVETRECMDEIFVPKLPDMDTARVFSRDDEIPTIAVFRKLVYGKALVIKNEALYHYKGEEM